MTNQTRYVGSPCIAGAADAVVAGGGVAICRRVGDRERRHEILGRVIRRESGPKLVLYAKILQHRSLHTCHRVPASLAKLAHEPLAMRATIVRARATLLLCWARPRATGGQSLNSEPIKRAQGHTAYDVACVLYHACASEPKYVYTRAFTLAHCGWGGREGVRFCPADLRIVRHGLYSSAVVGTSLAPR